MKERINSIRLIPPLLSSSFSHHPDLSFSSPSPIPFLGESHAASHDDRFFPTLDLLSRLSFSRSATSAPRIASLRKRSRTFLPFFGLSTQFSPPPAWLESPRHHLTPAVSEPFLFVFFPVFASLVRFPFLTFNYFSRIPFFLTPDPGRNYLSNHSVLSLCLLSFWIFYLSLSLVFLYYSSFLEDGSCASEWLSQPLSSPSTLHLAATVILFYLLFLIFLIRLARFAHMYIVNRNSVSEADKNDAER